MLREPGRNRESECLAQPERRILLHIEHLKGTKNNEVRRAVIGGVGRERQIRAKSLRGVLDHVHGPRVACHAACAEVARLIREQGRMDPCVVHVVTHSMNQIEQPFNVRCRRLRHSRADSFYRASSGVGS